MSTPKLIVNLHDEESRVSEVMAGPWQDIRLARVNAGESSELSSVDIEHAAFVVAGTGTLTSISGDTFPLERGAAFAIPAGGSVTVAAETDVEFLHVTMELAPH
jgi:quercetin dioxygenase-like cupin family protein